MKKKSKILFAVILASTTFAGIQSFADPGGVPNANAKGYWTQDRMNSAIPIELVVDELTGVGRIQPAAGAKTSGKPGTTSGSTTIQSTTDWPTGAKIAQTAVGKVFFSTPKGNYVCSGALAKDGLTTRAIVATAGHCVWEQNASGGAFVSNWAFVPDYDTNPNAQLWYASALLVRDEFAAQTSFNAVALQNDWGFAVIQPIAGQLPDQNDSNAYAISIGGFVEKNASFAFGYPAAAPFDGKTLKYAGATIFTDPKTAATWGMNSTMTGGASGGPWLSYGVSRISADFGALGSISSVNSYKYTTDSTKMYGPKFNSRTTKTFEDSKFATSNTRVVG